MKKRKRPSIGMGWSIEPSTSGLVFTKNGNILFGIEWDGREALAPKKAKNVKESKSGLDWGPGACVEPWDGEGALV